MYRLPRGRRQFGGVLVWETHSHMYGLVIWFSHIMKTTLNLDEKLLGRAKKLAASQGVTLTAFIEDALRTRITPRPKSTRRFELKLPTVRGERPPAVDVADRSTLLDLLERQS